MAPRNQQVLEPAILFVNSKLRGVDRMIVVGIIDERVGIDDAATISAAHDEGIAHDCRRQIELQHVVREEGTSEIEGSPSHWPSAPKKQRSFPRS